MSIGFIGIFFVEDLHDGSDVLRVMDKLGFLFLHSDSWLFLVSWKVM